MTVLRIYQKLPVGRSYPIKLRGNADDRRRVNEHLSAISISDSANAFSKLPVCGMKQELALSDLIAQGFSCASSLCFL
jgi:ABC-type uncharacterized transport system ATPase subunit